VTGCQPHDQINAVVPVPAAALAHERDATPPGLRLAFDALRIMRAASITLPVKEPDLHFQVNHSAQLRY